MRTIIDLRTVAKCQRCKREYKRKAVKSSREYCPDCRPWNVERDQMSDREKQIRDWLKELTVHELHLLKTKWIHEEQSKRRGIVITPKKPDDFSGRETN